MTTYEQGAHDALTRLDQQLAAAQDALRLHAIDALRANDRTSARRCEAKRAAHQGTRTLLAQQLADLEREAVATDA